MNNILHAQGMLVPGLESNRHFLDHRLIRTFWVLFSPIVLYLLKHLAFGSQKIECPEKLASRRLGLFTFHRCKPPSLQVHALKSCSAGGAESVDPVDATVDNATF